MILNGNAHLFGDGISTDHIIPGRYYHLRSDLPALAKHAMEDADPEFASRVKPGDFIVAGRNFGLGSSREHAPIVIKMAGCGAVIAESFARIFFRNAINIGLPVLIAPNHGIKADDALSVDLTAGTIRNVTTGKSIHFAPLPPVMVKILADGGLIEHLKAHGGFAL
jgi:3-isopropylmalate/(R)-2-methylmalate dehydratase small subunit